jgi:hypothetical protein
MVGQVADVQWSDAIRPGQQVGMTGAGQAELQEIVDSMELD